MYLNIMDVQVGEEQYKDILREAETERLLQELPPSPSRIPWLTQKLHELRQEFSTWACKRTPLQATRVCGFEGA